MADSSGSYSFAQITPSKYTIVAKANGFGDQTKSAELLVNQPATIDFALSVEANTVTVDVSAIAQTLNTSDASLGNSADNALIQALPSETRNVPDLAFAAARCALPAVDVVNDSRSGAVNGGRSDQGNVTIDGVDDNDQVNGYAFKVCFAKLRTPSKSSALPPATRTPMPAALPARRSAWLPNPAQTSFTVPHTSTTVRRLTAANNWFNKQAADQ